MVATILVLRMRFFVTDLPHEIRSLRHAENNGSDVTGPTPSRRIRIDGSILAFRGAMSNIAGIINRSTDAIARQAHRFPFRIASRVPHRAERGAAIEGTLRYPDGFR